MIRSSDTTIQTAQLKGSLKQKESVINARSIEYLKCKSNPLYFLQNYVHVEETGGALKLKPELVHNKIRRVVRTLCNYHRCVFMASRQLGKSTIAAVMIDWAMIFFPRIECVILNMKKNAALKNLSRIKFIHDNLPDWMKVPHTSKSDIKTYFTLKNGSGVTVYYPSTVHDPSTMARSLTIPILYIDEAAFITHMVKIYGSAQQTLSKAREQAIKNGYPYFQLITSTPNGIYGDGEWFFKRYQNSIESDELFIDLETGYEDWNPNINIKEKLLDPTKNSFIKVSYHWKEDPSKSQAWYEEQCREIDDDRVINQELDLVFVGSSKCIFSDTILSQFKSKKDYELVNFPRIQTDMKVFKDYLDPNDYYLIGIDTASSTKGAFDSIEIFTFKNFEQVAEINIKLGSLTKYGELVDDVFQWLYRIVGTRIILCIENNSIGKAIVEHLLYHPENNFNYLSFMYKELTSKEYGINTNSKTKELMIACLYQEIKDNPNIIKSSTLISQLATIERSNSGTVSSRSYSDLFMAACFCAYVRKQRNLEIMPLLTYSNEDLNKQFQEEIAYVAKYSDPKTKIKEDAMREEFLYDNESQQNKTIDSDLEMFMPIFNDFKNESGSGFGFF